MLKRLSLAMHVIVGEPEGRPQEQFDEAMVADDLKGDLFKV